MRPSERAAMGFAALAWALMFAAPGAGAAEERELGTGLVREVPLSILGGRSS